jgi:hypothetical protein
MDEDSKIFLPFVFEGRERLTLEGEQNTGELVIIG